MENHNQPSFECEAILDCSVWVHHYSLIAKRVFGSSPAKTTANQEQDEWLYLQATLIFFKINELTTLFSWYHLTYINSSHSMHLSEIRSWRQRTSRWSPMLRISCWKYQLEGWWRQLCWRKRQHHIEISWGAKQTTSQGQFANDKRPKITVIDQVETKGPLWAYPEVESLKPQPFCGVGGGRKTMFLVLVVLHQRLA